MRRLALAGAMAAVFAGLGLTQRGRVPEPLTAWRYFKEVPVAAAAGGPLESIALDREILDQARTDEADLRLYDSAGREVPYALRIRRQIESEERAEGRTFNRAVDGNAAVISVDLGAQPAEHNQVEVATAGDNFRRLADVEGSADGAHWSSLATRGILFRFVSGGRTAEQDTISYPVSRFRYLRVRVESDPQVDAAAPEITDIQVRHITHMEGEMTAFPGTIEGPAADRQAGRPATIWRIDLGGRVPISRATIVVREQAAFTRPFVLESADDPAKAELLASGDLKRREEDPASGDLELNFAEHFVRRLKLTVVDDRNAPLAIAGFTGFGATRQIVFPAQALTSGPLRLYYGNPDAIAPHYDLGVQIASESLARAARLTAGPPMANPVYQPKALPLSERSPWLVYIVLVAASLLLAGILWNIARSSRRARKAGETGSGEAD